MPPAEDGGSGVRSNAQETVPGLEAPRDPQLPEDPVEAGNGCAGHVPSQGPDRSVGRGKEAVSSATAAGPLAPQVRAKVTRLPALTAALDARPTRAHRRPDAVVILSIVQTLSQLCDELLLP